MKFMDKYKSIKRMVIQFISIALTLTIIVSVAPITVSANTNSNNTKSISKKRTDTFSDKSNWTDEIVEEVISERDEFSKTYILTDGSYYKVSSAAPIHYLENGEWIDISNDLSLTPTTISNATNEIALANFESDSSEYSDNAFLMQAVGNTTVVDNTVTFKKSGGVLIKPQSIYPYSNNDKLILEAKISVNVTANAATRIEAREINQSWDTIDTNTNLSDGQLIDYFSTTDESSDTTINITDIFSKWDRGTREQYGIVLLAPSANNKKSYVANNFTLSVRYIDVSENDSKFTKHSLDMGVAGKLHINDVTNTVKIEQDIIGIDMQVLPVNITRTVYSPVNDFDSTAGISSSWNYNNSVSLEGNILTWTRFDGSKIKFKKPTSNITVDNAGYQKWLPNTSTTLSLNAELWISEDIADSNGLNTDYSSCYIKFNDSTYNFNITGNISSIEKYGKQIQFTYGSLGLSSITDPVGNKYNFSYSRYNINIEPYYYVSKISVTKPDNTAVKIDGIDYCVNFNNTYNSQSQKVTSTITFCDGKTVSYIYDLYGRVCEIIDANGGRVVVNYKDSSSNISTGYIQYSSSDNEAIIDSLEINDDSTYLRTFTDFLSEEEKVYFDSNYNLICNEYKGNIVCLQYDETNLISSYAFKDHEIEPEDNLLTNGVFSSASYDWSQYETLNGIDSYESSNEGMFYLDGAINKTGGITFQSDEAFRLQSDQTYILEVSASTSNVMTSTEGKFGLAIHIYDLIDSELVEIETRFFKFDNTLASQMQTKLIALKFEQPTNIDISIFEENLTGRFNFGNVKLYEASEDDASVGLPNMDNTSPITTTHDDNGNIVKETIEREPYSMIQTYGYSEDGSKLTSMTDYNGLTTYYSYDPDNGFLSQKGHSIVIDGNIVDPTVYAREASGLISEITQTITDVIDGNEKTLSIQYLYDNSNRITSVTNNGVSYLVSYDENGNTSTISKQIGSQDATELNNYSYSGDNKLDEISYSDGSKIIYTYDQITGKISAISKYNTEGVLSETFTYSYDEYNNIVGVQVDYADLATDYKIEYVNNGFKFYNIIGENEILVFEKAETDTSYTEKHLSTVTGENALETFTQTKYAYVTDEITSATTGSSTISGGKNSALFENTSATYTIQNSTTLDTFDRVTNRHSIMSTNVTNTTNEIREANVDLLQQYSYEGTVGLNGNTTTGKVSSITTTATGQFNLDNEITPYNWSMNSHYVYDNNGNLQLVYEQNGETYDLVALYAYDEAGQVITEYDNTINNIGYQYSYNTNGNLSKKYFYTDDNVSINGLSETEFQDIQSIDADDWDTFDFSAIKAKKLTLSGNPHKIVELTYENDKVTCFTERTYNYSSKQPQENTTSIQITYDEYGNPKKHVEYNVLELVVSELYWTGNLLTSAIIYDSNNLTLPTHKFDYRYDENGYRTEKIQCEYDAETQEYLEKLRYRYIWDNGVLQSIHLFEYNSDGQLIEYYTNMIYDEKGYPCGYIDFSGNPFYFVRDINDSVVALVSADGNKAVTIDYDAFGAVKMTANGSNALEGALYVILAQVNPCTYKGYLYDYETGMYFIKNRCYSPSMGRFIDNDFEKITTVSDSVLEANPSVFCLNNSFTNNDVYGSWGRDTQLINWSNESIEIKMNKAFLSATFCTIYANQLVNQYGTFDQNKGNCIYGMDVKRIASNLFACCVGKYAEKTLNKVNTTWGEGWIIANRNNNSVLISSTDPNADKYLKIWNAAENIRNEALKTGIFISI